MQASVLGKVIDGPPLWSERSGSCFQGVCEGWVKNDLPCKSRLCLKRGIRQDEMGPFWANRGKRNPMYKNDRLFVQEPNWILVRRDDERGISDYDPFFTTRGKKFLIDDSQSNYFKDLSVRDRREHASEESPFFAARGKKNEEPAE